MSQRRKPRKTKVVKIKMNGHLDISDDEDAVKSGSATGFSDMETDERSPPKFNNRYDPVNMVLDKIDAELSSLSRSQSSNDTGSTVVNRSGSHGNRSHSSNQDDLTTSQLDRSGSSHRSTSPPRGRTSSPDPSSHRHITGTAEMYREPLTNGEGRLRTGAPSDLDSEAAQQVDEKFKEILKKKKGGYMNNLRASYPQSDADTIRTEDFERRFQNAMVYNSDSDTLQGSISDRGIDSDDPDFQDNPDTTPATQDNSDNTPNQGARDRQEIPPIQEEAEVPPPPRMTLPLQSKSVGATSNTDYKSTPNRRRLPRQIYASDAESVKTEDFEIRFRDLMVRAPPVNGPETEVESDINDPLHRKVKEILRLSAPYNYGSNGLQGPVDEPPRRRQNNDRWRRRHSEVPGGNDGFQNGSVRHATLSVVSNSGDGDESLTTSSDSPNWSLSSKAKGDKRMSTSSVGTSSVSSGFLHNSGRQTPDRPLSESRTTSWSSLMLGDNGDFQFSANQSPVSSPQLRVNNPLLEKLFEDSLNIKHINERDGRLKSPKSPQRLDGNNEKRKDSRRRELILPEEEEEEFPFAKYTFNKKPDKDYSSSPSEVSCSSHESSGGGLGFESAKGYGRRQPITSQESKLSTWTTSLTSGLSEEISADVVHGRRDSSPWAVSFSDLPNQAMLDRMSPNYRMSQMNYLNMMPASNCLPYPPVNNMPDQVLAGLGFAGGCENFLPERFAQDWYNKIYRARFEIMRRQYERQRSDFPFPDYTEYEPSSIQSSGRTTPLWRSHSDSIRGKQSYLPATRTASRTSLMSGLPSSNTSFDAEFYSGPSTASDRQNSIDRIRELLKAQQPSFQQGGGIGGGGGDAKDMRRKQFVGNRQNSLPTYLETLTEEEENRSLRRIPRGAKRLSRLSEAFSKEKESDTSVSQSDISNSGSEASSRRTSADDVFDAKTSVGKSGRERVEIFVNVPSITINESSIGDSRTVTSNDSLEIADILYNERRDLGNGKKSANFKSDLQVEPAMMSVVLNDTGMTKSEKSSKEISSTLVRPQYLTVDLPDDRLLPPATPSSTSSVSPCPLSPVTVIEVSLDNQNDSLDTDEGQTGSRKNSVDSEALDVIGQFASRSEGVLASGLKTNLETIVETSSNKSSIEIIDISNEKDGNDKRGSVELRCIGEDIGIQADDGSLIPIVRFSDFDEMFKKLLLRDDGLFYVARDQETQCDSVDDSGGESTSLASPSRKSTCFFPQGKSNQDLGTPTRDGESQTNPREFSCDSSTQYNNNESLAPYFKSACSCHQCKNVTIGNLYGRNSVDTKHRNSLTIDIPPVLLQRYQDLTSSRASNDSADSNFSRIFSSSICEDDAVDLELFTDELNMQSHPTRRRHLNHVSTSSEEETPLRERTEINGFGNWIGRGEGSTPVSHEHGLTIHVPHISPPEVTSERMERKAKHWQQMN